MTGKGIKTSILAAAALASLCLPAVRPGDVSGANVPLREVYSPLPPARRDSESFRKVNIARTALAIRETARINFLDFTSMETCAPAGADPSSRSDRVDLQFSFLTYDILNAANFIEDMVEGYPDSGIALVSFSLVRQQRPGARGGASVRQGGAARRRTSGIFNLTARFRKTREPAETNPSATVMADISRLVKFCGGSGYDVSCANFSEGDRRLVVVGDFSINGTKKKLVGYLDSRQMARMTGYRISEKEIASSASTVVIPFWLGIDFSK